jgi:hypothetical protein
VPGFAPNIAAGAGRRTSVDQTRFYTHARGSAMEAAMAIDTRVSRRHRRDAHEDDLIVDVQGAVQVRVNA